jgi:basic membrane lipoprotein Med (substrate-binding protein (PBP1-ABC) superfamily)
MSPDENEESSEPSSRKTSTSTVKAVTTAVQDLELATQNKTADEKSRWFGLLDHVDELEAPKKPSDESKDASSDAQEDAINHARDAGLANRRWEEVYMKGKD